MIQLQVINHILSKRDSSIILLNNLNEDYFSDYKDEFRFIKNHIAVYGKVPDFETFLSKFKNFDVLEVTEPVSYLLAELLKDKNERYLAKTFNKVRDLVMAGKSEEAMKLYKQASSDLVDVVSIQGTDIFKDTSRYESYVERLEDFDKFFISTGFKELDEIIGGWDRQEELATVIARLGQGKSWIILKMALAAAQQGLKVGLYSGEMSERKVGYRIDTLLGHISNGSLIHGNSNVQNEYKEYIDKLPEMIRGSLIVLTPEAINGAATVQTLRAFIEKEKLDVLFIDQRSLMDDDRRGKSEIEKASNISKDLKILQTVKRIPIITVSQMNRESSEDGSDTIDSKQIAQSDRIGQDSTTIIGISRDRKDKNMLKLQLVKSRDNEAGLSLTYNVNLNLGHFVYIPDAKDGEVAIKYEKRYESEPNGDEVF